jgi:carotenoid cleavage dioxygenase-like enzyme
VNSYFSSTGQLVVDVIGYDFLFFERFKSDIILNKTARDHGPYSDKRALTFRFVLDVRTGKPVSVEELTPKSDWEFPVINEAFKGKPYCYAFGYEFGSSHASGPAATGLASMSMIKYDMCAKNLTHDGKRKAQVFTRPYHYFVEPWFVPRPGSTAEDDGVVLVLALDGATRLGVLYVLDAHTLDVLATVRLPVLINLKTHGRFFEDSQKIRF